MTEAVNWEIGREGRAWHGEEALGRYALAPEKIEMTEGRLLWDDEARLLLLGLLLENLGVDATVRLGNPSVWHAAVADLPPGDTGQVDEPRQAARTLEDEERIAYVEGRLDAREAMSGRPVRCGSDLRLSIPERVAYLEGRLAVPSR